MLHTYQDILLRLLRSPAVWVFSAAWLLSVLALALTGYLEFLPCAFGCLSIALVVGLVTVALTVRASAQSPAVEQMGAPASGRKWIWAQVAVFVLFILFTGYRGVMLNYPSWLAQLPIVGPLAFSTLKLHLLAGTPS